MIIARDIVNVTDYIEHEQGRNIFEGLHDKISPAEIIADLSANFLFRVVIATPEADRDEQGKDRERICRGQNTGILASDRWHSYRGYRELKNARHAARMSHTRLLRGCHYACHAVARVSSDMKKGIS